MGYINKASAESQMNEIRKGDLKNKNKIGFFFRKFFEIGDWEYLSTKTGEKSINFFSYTLLRNKRLGKIIFQRR
jgi:hypothetical protein